MTGQRCEADGRPNVVLMVMHDLGDYLGCFVNRPEYEFYDLSADPNELVNVSEKYEYRQMEMQLREKLCRWLVDTNDPVLTNAMERPVDEYDLFPGDRDARNEHAKCLWEISSPCSR